MEYLLFLQKVREASPSFINYLFIFISEVLVSGMLIVPGIVYWCANKQIGQWMFLNYSGAYFINQIVKNTACVFRPWIRNPQLHLAKEAVKSATGYSFPSGHTTITTAVMESLAVWQKKRKWVVVLCTFIILLVAFARNWLGAHTLYDVIVAVLETSFVVVMNIFLIRSFSYTSEEESLNNQKTFSKDLFGLIVILIFIVVAMIYLQFKPYPLDTDNQGNLLADPYAMLTDCYTGAGLLAGFITGWFLERRFINFSMDVTAKQKLLRGLIGVVSIGLLYAVVLPFVLSGLGEHLKHFIKYFTIMILALAGYPAIFNAIEKRNRV